MTTLEFRTPLPVSAADAFAWHARPGAFARLTPPWEKVRLLTPHPGIVDGGRAELAAKFGPFWLRWTAVHRDCEPGVRFVDEQERGPFAAWRHEHIFERGANGAPDTLLDRVSYALPVGAVGRVLAGPMIRRKLERLFAYRHATMNADLACRARGRNSPRQRIAITGGSGLVGRALAAFLTTQGHEVVRFVRGAARAGEATWNPVQGSIDEAALGACDALIHLSGENVAGGRWTDSRRKEICESRVVSTRLLAETLARLPEDRRPRVWISASATGLYGAKHADADAWLDEHAPMGEGFLAQVVREWEAATETARKAGVRVVNLRVGVVLTPGGGALAKMLPPFRCGAGGPLGSGRQWLSWVSLDDLLEAIAFALNDAELAGPLNAVAPAPVQQREFAATLGRVLHRPSLVPVPSFALRALFGAMAEETVLASARVTPRVLTQRGFVFRHPSLEAALRHSLGCAAG